MKTKYQKALAFPGLVFGGFLLLNGCANKGYITAAVQSVIGLDVSENPQTQVPHVRFGFIRNQLYYIPTGKTPNSGSGSGQAGDTPELVSHIDVDIKFLQETKINEKFAVGPAAVSSGAARIMFAPSTATVPTVAFAPELHSLKIEIGRQIQKAEPKKLDSAKAWITGNFKRWAATNFPDIFKTGPELQSLTSFEVIDRFLDFPPEPVEENLRNLLKELRGK